MSGVREAVAVEVRAAAGRRVWWRFAVNESPDPWTVGVVVFEREIAGYFGISYLHEEDGLRPHTRVIDEVIDRVKRGTLIVTFDDPALVAEIDEEEAFLEQLTPEEIRDGEDVGLTAGAVVDHEAGVLADEAVDVAEAIADLEGAVKALADAERALEDARREEREVAGRLSGIIEGTECEVPCPVCGSASIPSLQGLEGADWTAAYERRVRSAEFVKRHGFVSACSECA